MMGDQPREPKGTSAGGRFARLPGPMDDDLADPAPVSPLMTTKGLAALLYRMGVTFDGLNTSRMATEEFLRTGNPRVIGSRDDYALLQDLRDAAEYTLGYDYDMEPFDMDWLQGINASMTRTAAMLPGEPRTERNVIVRTPDGIYTPPIPDSGALAGWLDEACRGKDDVVSRACGLFARIARAQPFGDGNKRTALLAANGLVLREHEPVMIAVPVDEPDRTVFNRLLGRWYLHDEPDVIRWLADWNRTNPAD